MNANTKFYVRLTRCPASSVDSVQLRQILNEQIAIKFMINYPHSFSEIHYNLHFEGHCKCKPRKDKEITTVAYSLSGSCCDSYILLFLFDLLNQ